MKLYIENYFYRQIKQCWILNDASRNILKTMQPQRRLDKDIQWQHGSFYWALFSFILQAPSKSYFDRGWTAVFFQPLARPRQPGWRADIFHLRHSCFHYLWRLDLVFSSQKKHWLIRLIYFSRFSLKGMKLFKFFTRIIYLLKVLWIEVL